MLATLAVVACLLAGDSPVDFGKEQLTRDLHARGLDSSAPLVEVRVAPGAPPESFTIRSRDGRVTVEGADQAGAMYGGLELAERIRRRGLIVLCSDLMDRPAEVLHGLQHFRHRHHEVVVLHILDPDESEFPYTDTATFVDMETGERLTTEPWEIARRYRERLEAWRELYRRQCRENRIDYVQLDTRTPFDQALLAYLEKRARLL